MFFFCALAAAEKPSLQSRHSLDSSRVQEKDKETGPLWITLALQKQKGFREQQQSRDERRSQREAKLAEKQSRDSVRTHLTSRSLQIYSSAFIRSSHASSKCPPQLPLMSPTDSKGCGSTGPSSKPQTPDEPKRPDSLLGRFERREQMKKAATLPSSVTGTHPHVQAAELRTFCNIYSSAKIWKTGKTGGKRRKNKMVSGWGLGRFLRINQPAEVYQDCCRVSTSRHSILAKTILSSV